MSFGPGIQEGLDHGLLLCGQVGPVRSIDVTRRQVPEGGCVAALACHRRSTPGILTLNR